MLPPDRGVDQLSGHPRLVRLEDHDLEGRAGGALERGRQEPPAVGPLEAPIAVVERAPLEEQRRRATPPRGLDGGRHQRGADPLPLPLGYDGQRAEHPHLDEVAPGVDPGPAEPDVADHDAALLGDEADPAVVAEALPDLRRRPPRGPDPSAPKAAVTTRRTAAWSAGCSGRTSKLMRGTLPGFVRCRHGDRLARQPHRPRDARALGQPGHRPRHASGRPHARQPDLLVGQLPAAGRRRRPTGGGRGVAREFEREFPEARHRTFGIDRTDGTVDDLAPLHRARAGRRRVERDDGPGGARATAAQHRGDVPAAGLGRRLGAADRGWPGPARTSSATTSPS